MSNHEIKYLMKQMPPWKRVMFVIFFASIIIMLLLLGAVFLFPQPAVYYTFCGSALFTGLLSILIERIVIKHIINRHD